ncbi:unnamed protein product [Protopolystoma xenopodis]|uniref:Uncharacterized protein n=1 Tax=Protopolystoma xenopodis TaxID=117903 RepID=A0A448XBJ4_9PLAT|nr:unnamed protein product [Protopolystoma xenopodis]
MNFPYRRSRRCCCSLPDSREVPIDFRLLRFPFFSVHDTPLNLTTATLWSSHFVFLKEQEEAMDLCLPAPALPLDPKMEDCMGGSVIT